MQGKMYLSNYCFNCRREECDIGCTCNCHKFKDTTTPEVKNDISLTEIEAKNELIKELEITVLKLQGRIKTLEANPAVGMCVDCRLTIWKRHEHIEDADGMHHPICMIGKRAEAAELALATLRASFPERAKEAARELVLHAWDWEIDAEGREAIILAAFNKEKQMEEETLHTMHPAHEGCCGCINIVLHPTEPKIVFTCNECGKEIGTAGIPLI